MYVYLGPSTEHLAVEFKKFVDSDCTVSPDLSPDSEHATAIRREQQALRQLAAKVESQVSDKIIRAAYHNRIEELLTNTELYGAALGRDARIYKSLNEKLYGVPSGGIFAAVCHELRANIEGWRADRPELEELCDGLLGLLPEALPKPLQLQPAENVFKGQRHIHFGSGGFYAELFAGVDLPVGQVTAELGDHVVEQVLANLNVGDFRLIDSPDSYWGVRYSLKGIIRPKQYSLTSEEFIAVVGHELGSHLLEWLNGNRQPLRLLGVGLQGVERGNEGRALLREQVAYPTWQAFTAKRRWQDIMLRHVTISLAAGIDGVDRDFSDVFRVINAYDLLWALAHGASHDQLTIDATRRQTWQLVARALKGTDGTNGMRGAYYKDIVYLEGNYNCWQLAARSSEIIRQGDRGKINIADPEHLDVLAAMDRWIALRRH